MLRPRWLLSAVLAALLAAGCGKGTKEGKIVADVGDRKITAGQLLIAYNRITPPNRPPFETLEQKKAFLDVLVAKEILTGEAESRRLAERPTVVAGVKGLEEQKLFKAVYAEKAQKAVVIDPAELEEFYKTNEAQVHVRDIWTKDDKASADAALAEIRSGKGFEEVARARSKNEFAAFGGDMGWLTRSSSNVAMFEEVLTTMKPGDVSDALATPAGYHIIQLVEEKPADMAEFEQKKIAVRNELRRRKEQKAWQKYIDELRAQVNFQPVGENVAMIRARAKEAGRGEIPKVSEAEKALPLVNYAGGTWTVGDLVYFLESTGPGFRPDIGDTAFQAETWMVNRAVSRAVLKAGRDMGLDKTNEFLGEIQRRREELMLDELHAELVKGVAITEEEKRAYFEANADSLRAPAGATVRFIVASSQAKIDSAYAAVEGGMPFDQAARRFSEDPSAEKTGGLVDTLLQGRLRLPEVDEAVFALEPGRYTKPYALQAGTFIVFQMVKKWAGRPLTYEETAAQIEEMLRGRKQNEVFDAWLAEKRKSLNVRVHDGVLNEIMAEETGAGA